MMIWGSLPIFASVSLLCALYAIYYAFKDWKSASEKSPSNLIKVNIGMIASILSYSTFVVILWISLDRPPFKTMGETRLWYSLFLLIIGWFTWLRTRYSGVLALSVVMSVVFMILNIAKPEIHEKELMPALDSYWFIPHVVVYMFAYALIGCACLIVINEAIMHRWANNRKALEHCDKLVWQGLSLLTMGMIMGALWAKQAWGDYWSWDPKETWAAITWLTGLIYIHLRFHKSFSQQMAYMLIIFLFLLFQICWYGINYLPSAQNSIHIYS